MRILIVGSGAREDSVHLKLTQEGHEVVAAPGNPGMASRGRVFPDVDIKKPNVVAGLVIAEKVDFTFVGPELPLKLGIVDYFNGRDLPIFGPIRAAAEIETSKAFCCRLLSEAGVPIPHTTYYESFVKMNNTLGWVDKPERIVLKKSSLAAGKGAEVVRTSSDLPQALARLEKLGEDEFLIQHMEEGPEMSCFVLTDSEDFLFLGSAQDYKPLYVGGPMTGGMGGFAPHPLLNRELYSKIKSAIIRPTMKALRRCGRPYRGVLYFQLMLTKRGPVVIEINCRFGDPETQLLMPLLDCKLLPLLQATTKSGFLRMMQAKFRREVTVGLTLSSEGYPDDPKLGRVIEGIEEAQKCALVFHAGTKQDAEGRLVTTGGRVLTVVGRGNDYRTARDSSYLGADHIHFEGKYVRSDIGEELVRGDRVS